MQNLDAIKLLKQLELENRKATFGEQEILSKFNGWENFDACIGRQRFRHCD